MFTWRMSFLRVLLHKKKKKKPTRDEIVATPLQIISVYEYLFSERPYWQMDHHAQLGRIMTVHGHESDRIQALFFAVPEYGTFSEAYLMALIKGADYV